MAVSHFARLARHLMSKMSERVVTRSCGGGQMCQISTGSPLLSLKWPYSALTGHRAVTELQTLEPWLDHSVIFSAPSQSEWSEERGNDVRGHS